MYNLGDKVSYTNNKGKVVWRGYIIDKSILSGGKVIYMIREDNGLVRSVAEQYVRLDKEWYREQKLNSILNE